MRTRAISRRTVFEASLFALAAVTATPGIAGAYQETGLGRKKNEETIRKYYAAWETRDWHPVDILLADNFTFTSANHDDHISKSAFKARCWGSQIDFIERFDVEKVFGEGDEAFVKYLGRTKNGKSFQNVDYFQLKDGKVEAIECYFGGQFGFPSAASTGKR